MNTTAQRLAIIQVELKAPKGQYNTFGKYNYRSTEDILEAVKPLLFREGLLMIISDDMVDVAGEAHVKATVRIHGIDGTFDDPPITASGWAREAKDQKGMTAAQITGSTSSYARKYALNGLFLIDCTKDDDATNQHGKGPAEKPKAPTVEQVCAAIEAQTTGAGVGKAYTAAKKYQWTKLQLEVIDQTANAMQDKLSTEKGE